MQPLASGRGYIAYARFDEKDTVIVICNSLGHAIEVDLNLQKLGLEEGTKLVKRFMTSTEGVSTTETVTGVVGDEDIRLRMPPYGAAVFTVCCE